MNVRFEDKTAGDKKCYKSHLPEIILNRIESIELRKAQVRKENCDNGENYN